MKSPREGLLHCIPVLKEMISVFVFQLQTVFFFYLVYHVRFQHLLFAPTLQHTWVNINFCQTLNECIKETCKHTSRDVQEVLLAASYSGNYHNDRTFDSENIKSYDMSGQLCKRVFFF